ncbi:MAG: glycosyltransferase family 4 protein [Bacteroidales bacterium]
MEQKLKKHILFLTPGFPEDENDTSCIPALQIFIRHLQSKQLFSISVITFQYPYRKNNYVWNGCDVYAIGGRNKKGFFRFLTWQEVLKTANKIHKSNPIDQVHSFWFTECAYVGNKISEKLYIPHSCTFMGQDALPDNNYLKKIKKLPQIITLSRFHAKTLKDGSGIESDFIIPWGIEEIEFPASQNKAIDIVGVGNLIPLKAFDSFIKVVKEVKQQIPDIKAEIIGEGPEMENLQRLVEKNGLETNILLRGKMDRAEVLNRMGQSRCLLHLSDFESFGMVLIEARKMGAKVFSTRVGIAPEVNDITIIENQAGASKKIIEFLLKQEKVFPMIRFPIEDTIQSYLENVFV